MKDKKILREELKHEKECLKDILISYESNERSFAEVLTLSRLEIQYRRKKIEEIRMLLTKR